MVSVAGKKPVVINVPGKNCAAQCPECRSIIDVHWSANEGGYVPKNCKCGVRIKWGQA